MTAAMFQYHVVKWCHFFPRLKNTYQGSEWPCINQLRLTVYPFVFTVLKSLYLEKSVWLWWLCDWTAKATYLWLCLKNFGHKVYVLWTWRSVKVERRIVQ